MFTAKQARLALVALLTVAATTAQGQQTVTPAADPAPEVGALAPDFAIKGATRYGIIRDSVHLSDFRGKTVVLAFFYRARTKG